MDFEDPYEALTWLRQTSTITSYQEAFERLSHRVDGLSESFLIGCFIACLRDEICLELKIKHLTTLAERIGVARLIKEKNQLQHQLIGLQLLQWPLKLLPTQTVACWILLQIPEIE